MTAAIIRKKIPNIIRKLSNSESLFIEMGDGIFTMVSCVRAALTPDIVQQALSLLIKRHPFLNCGVCNIDNEYYFYKIENYQVPFQVIENTNDQKNFDIFKSELNNKLMTDVTLIRVTMTINGTIKKIDDKTITNIYLTVSHAIMDGISCIQLHKELLEICAALMLNTPFDNLAELTILPAIEDFIPNYFHSDADIIVKELKENLDKYQPIHLAPMRVTEKSLLKTNLVQCQISPDIMKRFYDACKNHHVTIHSGVCAALLTSIYQLISNNQATETIILRTSTDLRGRISPAIESHQLLTTVTGIVGFHRVGGSIHFWDLAKDIGNNIQKSVRNDALFKMHTAYRQILSELNVPISINVSNIGRLNIPNQYGNIELLSLNVATPIFKKNIAVTMLTFNESLFCNFHFCEPKFSLQQVEKIKCTFVRILTNLSN